MALDDVCLTVPRGVVLGLVGENGAGKTTLISHVLGLLKAETGSVRVFGLDPVRTRWKSWRGSATCRRTATCPAGCGSASCCATPRAFYPSWDDAFAEELRRSFQLDPAARLKDLSQGQRARAGLLVALAYRPDLLVLDEPSTGLDPVVRRDILGAIIRTIADEGRTVLFSSHLLDEVERRLGPGGDARPGEGGPVGSSRRDQGGAPPAHAPVRRAAGPPAGVRRVTGPGGAGRDWTAVCRGPLDQIEGEAAALGARIVAEGVPTLDEIFVARVGARRLEPVEA